MTTIARTLIDCAEPAVRADVGALLHESSVQQVLDMNAIWEVLARRATSPGARRLAVAVLEEHPFTRSGLERAFLALANRHHLPRPEVNAHVWDGYGLVEVDFLWREQRVIVEVDGSRYHSTRGRRRRDAAKDTRLRHQGQCVLRFRDVEVAGAPARVAATVLEALAAPAVGRGSVG